MTSTNVAEMAISSPNVFGWFSAETMLLFLSGTFVYVAVQRFIDDTQKTVFDPALRQLTGLNKLQKRCAVALADDAAPETRPWLCRSRPLNIKWIEFFIAVLNATILLLIGYWLIHGTKKTHRARAEAMMALPTPAAMAAGANGPNA